MPRWPGIEFEGDSDEFRKYAERVRELFEETFKGFIYDTARASGATRDFGEEARRWGAHVPNVDQWASAGPKFHQHKPRQTEPPRETDPNWSTSFANRAAVLQRYKDARRDNDAAVGFAIRWLAQEDPWLKMLLDEEDGKIRSV